jgi:rare lipoprotein A (peptidoglycan hydrolase)
VLRISCFEFAFNFVSCKIKNTKGVNIIPLILTLWLVFSHPNQQVAGVNTYNDPNHPVEIYYGEPLFRDLKSMIENLGITVYPEDKVETVPEPDLGIGSQIRIIRATKVNIIDAKKSYTYHTWQTSITDLLKEKGIGLLGQDSVSPEATSLLSYNMNVVITRVAEVEVTETEAIDFKVIKKPDSSLEKGNTSVDQKGVKGIKEVKYLVKRIDGVEVARSIIDTNVVKEAVNQIQIYGTKVVTYGTGKATWYGRKQTLVAAHNSLPKGTKVRVVNTSNGKSVVVTIDDRGIQGDAIIDLSSDAFAAIASLGAGIANVRLEKYYPE